MGIRNFRGLAAAAVAAIGILMGGVSGVLEQGQAHALTNCSVTDLSQDAEEQAFLSLINTYRAQNGLNALTLSTNLNRAATWKAVDLATKNYFSHTDSLGRAPATLAVDCGYPLGSGENLAAGTYRDTAQEAFDAWKASAGHNQNMLTSYYQQIGIARYYSASSTYSWYWVTEFGTTDDGTGGGSSGGGGTTTPVTPSKGAMTSPANGTTLSGSSVTFIWSAGSGALEYFLYAGSSAGSNSYYGASQGTALSGTVSTLPTNGSTVYMRLWTRLASGWQYTDYTYRAATVSTGGSGGATLGAKATLLSPAAGAYLASGSTEFTWAPASGGLEYFLYVGTFQGTNNLYGRGQGTATSATISLPTYFSTVWVRLWTRTASGWTYNDYSFAGIY